MTPNETLGFHPVGRNSFIFFHFISKIKNAGYHPGAIKFDRCVGGIDVHTVSSIPPVHPPIFSDMRKHTRRRSPAIVNAYRDKVMSQTIYMVR